MLPRNGGLLEDSSQKEKTALEHLRNLVENLDITPNENYLKRFLFGTNFNIEEAFKKIKANREQVLEFQDWYQVLEPLKLKNVIDMDVRVMLPDCDKEGRPIYLVKNGNVDVSKMSLLEVIAVDDVWIESLLTRHPEAAAKGLCVVMDIKDQSWKLSKWMQPDYVKRSMRKIENLPFKDYKIHVINNSWWISIGIKIMWPFMPQKFKDMVKFHFDNLDSFYEYIDKKVVPIEYGGFKEIKYSELYDNLYKRNDEIFRSFDNFRNVDNARDNVLE